MNNREKIKEQYELLTEIESLEEIVEHATNSGCTPIHFELVDHYSNLSGYDRRDIKPKHSNRIIQLLKEIILELGDKLHKLENTKQHE